MTDIHQAYVTSLLNGGGIVRTRKGHHLQFQHGGGFWSDVWSKVKSVANKVLPTVIDVGKSAAQAGLAGVLKGDNVSIKDRLKGGLRGVRDNIIDRKDDLIDAGLQAL